MAAATSRWLMQKASRSSCARSSVRSPQAREHARVLARVHAGQRQAPDARQQAEREGLAGRAQAQLAAERLGRHAVGQRPTTSSRRSRRPSSARCGCPRSG
jgi:hypothetical protein